MTNAITSTIRRPLWMTPFGEEAWGDVFFDRLWPEWRRDMGEEWAPTVNLSEKDGAFHLEAELPGINKEDISITVENGIVTLSGKKESAKEEKTTEYYLKETTTGSFSRSFRLPAEVDEAKVDATYKDGVLTVLLPRKEETKAKKIEVH